MPDIEWRLERPALMFLLIPAVLIMAVFWFSMGRKVRRTGKAIGAAILHACMAAVLVLLASGFSVGMESERQSTVLLLDFSDSTVTAREDMEQRCAELLSSFDSEDVAGVVAFGQNTVFLADTDFSAGHSKLEAVDTSGSDLAAAMQYALKLMKPYTHKRIVLLSDGKQTSGDAEFAAGRLAQEGVRIDTMYFDTTAISGDEVQIRGMTALGGTYVGDEIHLYVKVESNIACTASLSVSEGDTLIETQTVSLVKGENQMEFTVSADRSGTRCFQAELTSPNDTELRNNKSFAAVQTYGNPNVLILASDPSKAESLKKTLSSSANVTVMSQANAPDTLLALCRYDSICLMNVSASLLPEGFGDMLDTVVKTYGKSVCFVGGDHTFSLGDMADTVYETMNPLKFGAGNGTSTALVLIIDASASMVEKTNYLELAKIGAIRVLDNLQPNDYVSVISFSSYSTVQVKLMKATAENKKMASSAISSIVSSPGTTYSPPLENALNILSSVKADTKHIIFLSDGEPMDTSDNIMSVVQNLRSKGVTVSTIGMNKSASSLGVLRNMASVGNGRYYYVNNAIDLPDIMFGESETVASQYAFTSPFTPVVSELNSLTESLGDLPSLGGYVGMRAKEDVSVYLTADKADPLYAIWNYGAGKVACFTSDLSDEWCSAWFSSPACQSFTVNAMLDSLPEVRYDATLIPTIETDGSMVMLTVKQPFDETDYDVIASITGPVEKHVQLDRISGTDYQAEISLPVSGEYHVSFAQTKRGKTVDETERVFALSCTEEYNMFRQDGQNLLSALSAASGGILTENAADIAQVDMGILRAKISMDLPLCILVVVLLLAEIILRKFTVTDFKKLFGRRHTQN